MTNNDDLKSLGAAGITALRTEFEQKGVPNLTPDEGVRHAAVNAEIESRNADAREAMEGTNHGFG